MYLPVQCNRLCLGICVYLVCHEKRIEISKTKISLIAFWDSGNVIGETYNLLTLQTTFVKL